MLRAVCRVLHHHRPQKEVPLDLKLMADTTTTFVDFSEIHIGAGASQADALLFVCYVSSYAVKRNESFIF